MVFTVASWRPAWRSLLATPLVTTLAVLSLALGIGANTALFSILNSLLLKPLPVHDPAGLVLLEGGSWTYPIWEQVQARETELFAGAFAWSTQQFDLSQGGETEPVDGAYVSGAAFDVLGVAALRGRMLRPADDTRGGGPGGAVAVISHRFWQRRFGGADGVIGQRMTLQRVPFTIVGVMPAGFFGPDVGRASDVMIPFGAEPLIRGTESYLDGRSTWWLEIMARLKPGQSVESATAALGGVQPQIKAATTPELFDARGREQYLREGLVLTSAETGQSPLRSRFRAPLVAMVAAVGLVLLIACANIANLLLARALARRREFSVRLALGASRWQLARLLLAESVMMAGAGAALGLVFAGWSSALLTSQFATWRDTVFLDLSLDGRVLAFTAGLTMLTALVSGLAPALGVSRVAPNDALKDAGRGIAGDRRFGVRNTLVVVQIALSLVLIVGAGLFLRTFTSLTQVPLGFTPDPLLVVNLNLQTSQVGPSDRGPLVGRLRDAAASVPGVTSAAVSLIMPISGGGWNSGVGDTAAPDRSRMTWMNATTPDWFATYGMRMIAGRTFGPSDRIGSELVAVVNESFARRFLPGQQPVGQTTRTSGPGGSGTTYRIIGLVSDAVYRNLRDGAVPTLYVALEQRQQMSSGVALTVSTAPGQRAAVERSIASALKQVDPTTSFTFRTFDQLVAALVVQERLVALLSSFFGGLALLLAGIGLYGVVSHAVGRRRTEIGVRMALGADPAGIVRLVFRQVGVLIAAGIAAGITISVWLSGFVTTLLFNLDARDPVTFVTAAAVLIGVGVLAAWLPARRAARLDPASILREG